MGSPIARGMPRESPIKGGFRRAAAPARPAHTANRALTCADRCAEHVGGFFDAQPGVIAELNDLPSRASSAWSCWIASSRASRSLAGGSIQAMPSASSTRCDWPSLFETPLAAGLFDEDLAHGLRGRAEESVAGLPSRIPRCAPGEGTPRGPGPWAGGSGRGGSRVVNTAASRRSSAYRIGNNSAAGSLSMGGLSSSGCTMTSCSRDASASENAFDAISVPPRGGSIQPGAIPY